MPLPVVFADRARDVQKHPTIARRAIESLAADVERATAATAMLDGSQARIFFDDLFWDGLVKDRASGLRVLGFHQQAQTTDGVGVEPVYAHDVLVGNKGRNAG